MKLPKPKDGSAQYQGMFAVPAFSLFAGPSVLTFHENLFRALSKYGARVENLKIETAPLPSATYDLTFPLNCIVRVALDKIDISFYSLNVIGVERARELALACWKAIQSPHDGIALANHTLTVSYQFELGNEQYKKIVASYVNVPKELPADTDSGVVFYLPAKAGGEADQGASIVLDRLTPGTLNIRVVMIADATKLTPAEMPQYTDKYILGLIAKLGLEIEN